AAVVLAAEEVASRRRNVRLQVHGQARHRRPDPAPRRADRRLVPEAPAKAISPTGGTACWGPTAEPLAGGGTAPRLWRRRAWGRGGRKAGKGVAWGTGNGTRRAGAAQYWPGPPWAIARRRRSEQCCQVRYACQPAFDTSCEPADAG